MRAFTKEEEMEMVKWDPWWENDWPVSSLPGSRLDERTDAPVAIVENNSEYIIRTRVPEFRKEEIDVTIDHGVLQVLGEHDEADPMGYCDSFGVKPCHCSINRTFSLPDKIDVSGIRATMTDGWLKLEIPKSDGAQDQKIKVVVH
jgi:HSP20 family protein